MIDRKALPPNHGPLGPPKKLGWVATGVDVWSIGSFNTYIKVTDSWDRTRMHPIEFEVLDMDPDRSQVLLGIPWLIEHDPVTSFRTGEWMYRLHRDDLRGVPGRKELKKAKENSQLMVRLVTLNAPCIGRVVGTKWDASEEEEDTLPDGPLIPVVQSDPSRLPPPVPPDPTQPILEYLNPGPYQEQLDEEVSENLVPEQYREFWDVFDVVEAGRLPAHQRWDHAIEIEEGKSPPFGPIYPLAEQELAALRDYIKEATEKGWIRPSSSSAGAPILFVPKKGGQLRLCVDYRGLNKVTQKDRTPLPLMHEILDRLSSSTVYTKLDLKDAYHRLRIREGDEWKTAFRTKYGHFEYLVMPFGLCNAPASFQRYINEALKGLVDTICIVYLDDILIYSKDLSSHRVHVKEILTRLREWSLFANPQKCVFETQEVEFLGFICSPYGVFMDTKRVEAIKDWEEPNSVKKIQVFLGFTGFYRRFIEGYSKVAAPLTDLLRSGGRPGTFQLGDVERAAFEKLRLLFQSAPVLRHFNPALPTRVEPDASNFALGAVISQCEDRIWRPVAFLSRKLRGPELNYPTPDTELMAIVEAFRQWRHYLAYSQTPVEVLTDHLNHRYLLNKPRIKPQHARWLEELSSFDFEIRHRPGVLNPADGLSRKPQLATDQADLEAERQKPVEGFTKKFMIGLMRSRGVPKPSGLASLKDEVIFAQKDDPFCISLASKDDLSDPWSCDGQGAVYFRDRLFVPNQLGLRDKILQAFHDAPTAGHPGSGRTIKRVSESYHWEYLSRDVKKFVPTCGVCQRTKPRQHKPFGYLAPLPVPERPFQEISMDFVTGLPAVTPQGKKRDAILVVVCRFTKYALYIPCSSALTAEGLAQVLWVHVFSVYGLPDGIVSDRGSLFTSKFWTTLCSLLSVERRLSTAFHPQTDGQTERQNQNLEHFLRAFCTLQQDDWVDQLPLAQYTYNTAWHSAIRQTPSIALMGFNPRGPHDVQMRKSGEVRAAAAEQRVKHLVSNRRAMGVIMRKAQTTYERYYNAGRAAQRFKTGDYVLLSAKNIKQRRPNKKLSDKFLGPYKITSVVGQHGLAYKLQLPESMKIHNVFPISLLEPWKSRDGRSPTPADVEVEPQESEEYEVEEVLAHRYNGKRREYLIKWTGYGHEHNTWEPRRHLTDTLVEEYHKRRDNVS